MNQTQPPGNRPLRVALIGFGAIGQALLKHSAGIEGWAVTQVIVRPSAVEKTQALVTPSVEVRAELSGDVDLVIECAGHEALSAHVVPALQTGVPCGVLSIGALTDSALLEQLGEAACHGNTQLHVLPGAIGAVDALAAARLGGLDQVQYIGRKPPSAWAGVPGARPFDPGSLTEPLIIFEGSAREAARLFPKNANVAATVALAGLGLDDTQALLIADPLAQGNIHEIQARGAFGEMHLRLAGQALAENPRTSALTVLSALRFLQNRVQTITL
jgi:aspartate dehydrogenase